MTQCSVAEMHWAGNPGSSHITMMVLFFFIEYENCDAKQVLRGVKGKCPVSI